ncbi:MAG: LytR cell envelope-related transcriptional attenuator [Actinomycetota bacterium]|nr:LytR cell envelope-related transcriptional attenuator [Actinomycetota bacterium]
MLLAIAMVIGIVLLNATDAEPPGAQVTTKAAGSSGKNSGGGGGSSGTTTTVAPTTTLPTHAPRDVKVIVANASTVKGAGAKASDALKPPGYNVLAPANATAVNESAVYFVPGYDRDAAALAAALQFPATAVKPVPNPPPLADSKGANVVIILGADQAPRFASAAATTTTTAKPATGATTTTAKAATGATTTTTARPASSSTTSTTKKP